jgi:selenocysteine-specific elongation factor
MIIGTAGHIDHGKTALVRALTGIDTDRLKEEKERGITIELGFAYQPIDAQHPNGPRVGFVDMPGHERFIHTMLAGATGIGLALLVVAADDGVMPQTREHLQILQLLKLKQGAVALTKIDAVAPERVAEVRQQLSELLTGTFLATTPVFACSAHNGTGIPELRQHLHAAALAWHNSRATAAALQANRHFRLAVDRSFSIEGRGTIVTGTVHDGRVSVGDMLQVLPSTRHGKPLTARVRGLHAFNRVAEHGHSGERVALNLAGIERSDIHRGDWAVAEPVSHRSDRLAVQLQLLPEAKPLRHWTAVHVHSGAAHTLARVALLEGDVLQPGEAMLAELSLETPLHLCHGDHAVLRDASAQSTIAGCTVLDVFPPLRGKRSEERLNLLRALHEAGARSASGDRDALTAVLASETRGVNLSAFAANRNLKESALPALLAQMEATQLRTGDGLYACAPLPWQAMQDKVVAELEQFHQREPDIAGVERERLRRKSLPTLAPEPFAALLQSLVDDGSVVVAQGRFIALPGHKVEFSAAEQLNWEKVSPLLMAEPYQPPRVRPLAAEIGIAEEDMRRLLGKSARLGLSYRVAHDHYYLTAAVKDLAAQVDDLIATEGVAKAAPFRDRISTGRKLAIQILEFFDTIGYTRRIREHHVIRQPEMWR